MGEARKDASTVRSRSPYVQEARTDSNRLRAGRGVGFHANRHAFLHLQLTRDIERVISALQVKDHRRSGAQANFLAKSIDEFRVCHRNAGHREQIVAGLHAGLVGRRAWRHTRDAQPAESFSAETPSVGVRTVSTVARRPASGSSVFHGYGSRPSMYLALKSANDFPPAAALTAAHHCASLKPVPCS